MAESIDMEPRRPSAVGLRGSSGSDSALGLLPKRSTAPNKDARAWRGGTGRTSRHMARRAGFRAPKGLRCERVSGHKNCQNMPKTGLSKPFQRSESSETKASTRPADSQRDASSNSQAASWSFRDLAGQGPSTQTYSNHGNAPKNIAETKGNGIRRVDLGSFHTFLERTWLRSPISGPKNCRGAVRRGR